MVFYFSNLLPLKVSGCFGHVTIFEQGCNERVDVMEAAEMIHDHSTSTRFLIMLDDAWRVAEHENLVLPLGFSRGSNPQHKIMVTIERKHVFSNMKACVYELQPFSKEDSCNLFCSFSFH